MTIYKDITFIATTTNRVICFESLIRSIRNEFGFEPTILFAHQVVQLSDSIERFSDKNNVQSFATGYDSGLSYNRNFLMNKVKTKFFVLCDDDFIFDASVQMHLAIELMLAKDIDILGGVYKNYNFDTDNLLQSYNESSFAFDLEVKDGILQKTEVDLANAKSFKGLDYIQCDCVNNFSIMRMAPFLKDSNFRWDEDMKISGEHIDFYTRNKIKGYANVYFSPSLSVLHVRRSNPTYSEMRSRKEGLKLFESKVKKMSAF